jgi:hypothetical protein
MVRPVRSLLVFAVLLPLTLASAQQPARLRLFLDCHTFCDGQYLRTEITMVDWVTDRGASDLHVIATDLSTGAGGSEVTLEFIGRNALDGMTDRHVFRTAPDATQDARRQEFARVLRLGLVRFLLASNQGAGLRLAVPDADEDELEVAQGGADPWNLWVFTVEANGSFDSESREESWNVDGEVRASRVTPDWKFRFEVGADYDRTTFELDEGEVFTANRDSWDVGALLVRSLGPHWSAGAMVEAWSSTTQNFDFRGRLAAAIEWNLYPYAEATRRQFLLLYTLGINRFDYVEETIYSRTEETRADHRLQVSYETDQPWGSAWLSGRASSYLHDWSLNRLGASAGLSVRLARGLELYAEGDYSRVRDQITLRKGDATDEEIFLRLRELATGYRAAMHVGLSYTFGSFLNTVVNPRLDELD